MFACFYWRPVCVQVLVLWVASRVVRGGVVEVYWMPPVVGYPGGVRVSCRTCGCACCRQSRVPKKHLWMPGMSSSVRRKVYSVFSTVFLLLLLLAVGVGFPAACFGR